MPVRILLMLMGLFCCAGADAQLFGSKSATRAVVVGISDYQDEKITDLKFAHRDAEAFVSFLMSKSGGEVPEENIRMLTNKKATAAQIYASLDWLIEASEEGDKVMIYFSGHGDVETKTIRQRGYLLAHDTPSNNYRVGAIRLEDLNDILATLSQVNKTQIVLITDACHSGNLAGKHINGTAATATALTRQFANEVKIMSCQPDELSLEGEQWGGGRGLFSYHLLDALTGMADNNDDAQVNVREVERYLEDNVSREAAPQSQIPMAFGNKNTRLAIVDSLMLARLYTLRSNPNEGLKSIASKAPGLGLHEISDTTVLDLYAAFEAAVEDKYFLPSDRNDERRPGWSASELFDTLSTISEMQPYVNVMKRNLAAALQDESQQAIIAYLNTDPEELKKRWQLFGTTYQSNPEELKRRWQLYGSAYQSNPEYLSKAAELLGPQHYLYDDLMTKKLYFEGLHYRLEGEHKSMSSFFDTALVKLNQALSFDDQAAYIFNEIGMVKKDMRAFEDAKSYFDSAMVKAPTWALPPTNHLINYRILRQHELADSMGRLALQLKPDYYNVYMLRGINYERMGNREQAKEMYIQGLKQKPDDFETETNLATLFLEESKYAQARVHLENALENDSTYFWAHYKMGDYFAYTNKPDSAIISYQKTISIKPLELNPYVYLAYQYMYTDQFDLARKTLEALNKLEKDYFEFHFGMACWHSLQGNITQGLNALELAFQNGLPYHRLDDRDIDALKKSEDYQGLIDKYFPEK